MIMASQGTLTSRWLNWTFLGGSLRARLKNRLPVGRGSCRASNTAKSMRPSWLGRSLALPCQAFFKHALRRTCVSFLLVAAILGLEMSLAAAPFDGTLKPGSKRIRAAEVSGDADDADADSPGFFNTQQELEMEHMLPARWQKPLTNAGLDYVMIYTSEFMGNVHGGLVKGGIFAGVLEAGVAFDAEKLFGWRGATFYASSLMSHGPSLSDRLGDLYGGSSIESDSSVRLYQVWLEQSLFDDAVSVRVGQLAADREFLGTDVGTLFMNAAFGWPAAFSLSVDMPAYPVAAPGVRLRADASHFWAQAAVFTGKPEPIDDQGEVINGHGVYWNFNDSALLMWEAGYSTATEEESSRYPGVYKVGGWLHTGWFEDQYYDQSGYGPLDVFNYTSDTWMARRLNWGFYGVAEQKIWRPANAVGEEGLSVFGRVATVPSDRNLVSLSVDGGLHYVGLLPGRPRDVAGVAFAYNSISPRALAWARDNNFWNNPPVPLPDYEAVLEFTYRIEIKPWWYLQPDVQFIMHPGARLDILPGGQATPNALVIGLRSTLSF